VIEFRDALLWFARQGYVVVAPVRPGYGATAIEIPERGLFGLFFSGVGKCSDAEFREAGLSHDGFHEKIGAETPVFGRSSNGGFWPKKVKNALSFNGS
jgi:hypothetical protein